MGRWEKALECFCKMAKEGGIDFYLIGSVTASIRGVDIDPQDIDIIVDICDFVKAKRIFEDYTIEPFMELSGGDAISFFGKICMNNTVIEISAKPQNIYGRHAIEMLCWNGYIIKAQTLALLLRVYQKNGRAEYVNAINAYLTENAL